MSVYPGAFFLSGLGLFSILIWLVTAAACVYAFILFVKLARRGIVALDLYIHAKNLEIRSTYESAGKGEFR
ncbi:hypothetical protein C2I18_28700 [Paenibacillus sp. PK3_47]|uniref:hypothetical protein n=1 Tax=Paenibacillus sp. PK3_47 TaxID=2072642 RepID=UPI00201D8A7E|nr:hypothetical protein [Paenibacillus sp. PK3_47]UQZ37167.1 hypothetical protein C2I18_28700 [Paenibacillus sp. PK3_47]